MNIYNLKIPSNIVQIISITVLSEKSLRNVYLRNRMMVRSHKLGLLRRNGVHHMGDHIDRQRKQWRKRRKLRAANRYFL